MAISLVVVGCCSLLPFPCSAVCKGHAFGQRAREGPGRGGNQWSGGWGGARGGGNHFGQGGVEGPAEGGNFGQGDGEWPVGEGNSGETSAGGNHVGRMPPAPRGKTPWNHR
ncbi:hypothetical protein CFC21_033340 [Triticum aestivum]|uniref:Secreted protein n=1 Tax=Triticum aestivum TaxID=4565 RepID=A0A9R1F1Y5_WHEAT|nr:hypothetical protein CFC21_033340 [Triticum aestivum]